MHKPHVVTVILSACPFSTPHAPNSPPTHTHIHAEKETVFEVKVDDASCVYRAGSKLLFLRILQGSVVITLETQNGEGSSCA